MIRYGQIKEANVDDIITLCNIADEYSEFHKNLIKFMTAKHNKNGLHKLGKIVNGDRVIGARKAKKFYKDNSKVIDEINKRPGFIHNYDSLGNLRVTSCLDQIHQYILKNKDNLDKIYAVLEKIKSLGFEKIEFDENLDFTNAKYKLDTEYSGPCEITYFDNMEAMPNYQDSVIEYKTTGSNYKMYLECVLFFFNIQGGKSKMIDFKTSGNIVISTAADFSKNECKRAITLNSLVFDPSRLPDDISNESIFNKIVELKETKKEECTIIKDSVDLSVAISDLKTQCDLSNDILQGLNIVESKKELLEALFRISRYIGRMQSMSLAHDKSIANPNSQITEEKLRAEKQLYYERRSRDSMYSD